MKNLKSWINERSELKTYLNEKSLTDKEIVILFKSCCMKSKIDTTLYKKKKLNDLLDKYIEIIKILPNNVDYTKSYSVELLINNTLLYLEDNLLISSKLESIEGDYHSIIDLILKIKGEEIYPEILEITNLKTNEYFDLYDFLKENKLDMFCELKEQSKEMKLTILNGLISNTELEIQDLKKDLDIKTKELNDLEKEKMKLLKGL